MYALRQLQELLSHQVPNGCLAVIIKDALLLRLKQVKRERFGDGKRRARGQDESSAKERPGERTPSRYIPSEVRRAVWERDRGRCAFVARHGRRCSERRWIELHHVVPFAWGGESTVQNIELRCRTHNTYEGERIFGKVVRRRKKGALPAPTGFKTSATMGGEERARDRG